MRPPDEVRRDLVRQWLKKAEEDLAVAERLLSEKLPYLNAIGFHAQQSAEKFLKALLVRHAVEFPKTHDIDELLDLIATVEVSLAESLRGTASLSAYGVDIRYPGDFPEMTPEDAKSAVNLALEVRAVVNRLLISYVGGAGA
jgi:HEPN domain-containing protein